MRITIFGVERDSVCASEIVRHAGWALSREQQILRVAASEESSQREVGVGLRLRELRDWRLGRWAFALLLARAVAVPVLSVAPLANAILFEFVHAAPGGGFAVVNFFGSLSMRSLRGPARTERPRAAPCSFSC
eukprot:6187124-Pleurochrysis_carterae.AAC.2